MNLFNFSGQWKIKSSRGERIGRLLQASSSVIPPKSEIFRVHGRMKSWLVYHAVGMFFIYSGPDSGGDCVPCNFRAASQIKECSQSGINPVHHRSYKSLNTYEVCSLP